MEVLQSDRVGVLFVLAADVTRGFRVFFLGGFLCIVVNVNRPKLILLHFVSGISARILLIFLKIHIAL